MITDQLKAADDAVIRDVLMHADPMALRAAIYQLTLDERLLDIEVGRSPFGGYGVELPAITDPGAISKIRQISFEVLSSSRDRGRFPDVGPPEASFARALTMAIGEQQPDDESEFWWEEGAFVPFPRRHERRAAVGAGWSAGSGAFHVIVIGAGMAGVGAAVHLKDAGFDFTVIEKNPDVGGTWYENRYPGLRVDVQSRTYSYTWAADHDWDHHYATGSEILEYIRGCVADHGLRDHIRFEREVVALRWDESAGTWSVQLMCPDGHAETAVANVVISAVGLLSRPSLPDIEGLESFEGDVVHTARWDGLCDFTGKRAGLIGTGASGTQIVDGLTKLVEHLCIFQRAGVWLANVPNYTHAVSAPTKWLLKNVPHYVNWVRVRASFTFGDVMMGNYEVDPEWTKPGSVSAMNQRLRDRLTEYIVEKVGDRPDLMGKCVPTWPPMAKRIPKDNGWFDALRRDDVELVTDPIIRVTPRSIVTTEGSYPIDVIVVATGFHANRFLWPMEVVGRNETSLHDEWKLDGARAYLGMTVPGFPNLFCLYGPNTNPKTGGPCLWGELQVRYVLGCIDFLIQTGSRSIEVKRSVHEAFNERLDEELSTAIWMHPSQQSYYRNEFGRVATNAPWKTLDYWRWTRRPSLEDYHIE